MGLDYKKLERYEEAVEPLKEAIRINPKYATAHLNLSLVYYNLRNKDAAMKEYEILKELDGSLAEKIFEIISK